jgi:uncharacterized protein (DUF2164 family)
LRRLLPVAIEIPTDVRDSLITSIKQYFLENLDQNIGDLKATLILGFILKEIGPFIYNQAVHDVQTRMQEIVSELDGTCFEPESSFPKP